MHITENKEKVTYRELVGLEAVQKKLNVRKTTYQRKMRDGWNSPKSGRSEVASVTEDSK